MQSRKARLLILLFLLLNLVLLYFYFFLFPPRGTVLLEFGNSKKAGKLKPLFAIYGPGKGEKPYFQKPLAGTFDEKGNIYVSDTGNNRICVFAPNGEFLFEFGGTGVAYPMPGVKATWKPGLFNFPYGIAVRGGRIYVSDMLNGRIQVFDEKGDYLFHFPSEKRSKTVPLFPTSLYIRGKKLYVCDRAKIKVFNLEGNYEKSYGHFGTDEGGLSRPNGVAVDEKGNIYVSDSNNHRLEVFFSDGKVRWVLSGFGLPRGIDIYNDKVLFVDTLLHNVTFVSLNGKFLGKEGKRGSNLGDFNFPNDLKVSGDRVLVVERENNRVQVFKVAK